MKRLLLSAFLVSVGASSWWMVSRTAHFSIKKWDAKFETVLRHSLDGFGLTTGDLLSSVHEVRRDDGGEWIVHRVRVRLPDDTRRRQLQQEFRSAGAEAVFRPGTEPLLLVRRGGRLYHEIQFAR